MAFYGEFKGGNWGKRLVKIAFGFTYCGRGFGQRWKVELVKAVPVSSMK
jgi:hypothetical protein